MKKISLIVILLVLFAITLTSCSLSFVKSSINLTNVGSTTMTVSVDFSIDTKKKPDLTINDLNVVIRLYDSKGKDMLKEDQMNSYSTKATSTVNYGQLEPETSYVVKVYATYNNSLKQITKSDKITTKAHSTEENPNIISTAEDFINMGETDGYYSIANDIDFSTLGADTYAYSPLFEDGFTGVINGNGHTLKNFTFSITSGTTLGLIAKISEGKITDLNIDNFKMTASSSGSTDVGLLVGTISNKATISNVSITNSTVKYSNAASSSEVSSAIFAGRINATDNISISNISLKNNILESNAAAIQNSGGFTGTLSTNKFASTSISFSNIIVDNLTLTANTKITSIATTQSTTKIGGFAGYIENIPVSKVIVNNVTLNVSSTYLEDETDSDGKNPVKNGLTKADNYEVYTGLFAGNLNSQNSYDQIYVNGSINVNATQAYQTFVAGFIGLSKANISFFKNSVLDLKGITLDGSHQATYSYTNPDDPSDTTTVNVANYLCYYMNIQLAGVSNITQITSSNSNIYNYQYTTQTVSLNYGSTVEGIGKLVNTSDPTFIDKSTLQTTSTFIYNYLYPTTI